jgi:RNA-binding protein
MQPELNNRQIRYLKALGQKLDPVVVIGRNGVSDGFLKSLDEALAIHELVKVRFGEFKEEKKTLAPELAAKSASHLVQRVGNVALLFRQQPDAEKRKINF